MSATLVLVSTEPGLTARVASACDAASVRFLSVADPGDPALLGADLIICGEVDLDSVRRIAPRAPVLIYGSVVSSECAIEAIKRGAVDYLAGPIDVQALAARIPVAMSAGTDSTRPAVYDTTMERSDDTVDRIVGQSPAMQEVYKSIGRIAPREINVLITGESGTGKELVARALVHHSPRRDRPYLAINCAAIPETLLESELFGHEKGAFTGAVARRAGRFEQCHGGTLFLDEIGDIPLPTQAKLLRVLQDQEFQRVGGSDPIRCDVRIIAATHQPLEQLMAERRFRQDLFYRLDVARITVPPLREREVDVVLLAHHFVDRYNRLFGTEVRAFAPQTLPILLSHAWPGNVRELENAIKATLVMAHGHVLRPEFLPESVREGASAAPVTSDAEAPVDDRPCDLGATADGLAAFAESWLDRAGQGDARQQAIQALERELIRAALRRHAGRIAPAARHLGMSRTTLRRKMGEFSIDITTT